jgi:Na+/proline symporter
MILLYTFEGGVKTIVYTDTLQTTCMLAGLVICVFYILNQLNMGFGDSLQAMNDRGYSKIFFTDPNSKFFFLKQIIAGAFITVTMTGMDQEMMQKNISVKTLKDSQKNVMSMALTLATVIVIFLFLGGLLYLYAENLNIDVSGDKIFPVLAMEYMPPVVSVIFIIALISALFPSADGAITALTSTFCIDIIGIQRRSDLNEAAQKKIRQRVHLTFAAIFLVFVLIFKWVNDPSMIGLLLKIAAYTYGPLLGLFTFGIITKRIVKDAWVPYVCIAAPIICFILDKYQKSLLGSYEVGLELLIINGSITFLGLLLISKKGNGTV